MQFQCQPANRQSRSPCSNSQTLEREDTSRRPACLPGFRTQFAVWPRPRRARLARGDLSLTARCAANCQFAVANHAGVIGPGPHRLPVLRVVLFRTPSHLTSAPGFAIFATRPGLLEHWSPCTGRTRGHSPSMLPATLWRDPGRGGD
jgi:hypothetical protein